PVGLLGVFRIGSLTAASLNTMIQPCVQVGASNVVHHVNSRLVLNQALLVVSNLANRGNLTLSAIGAALSAVLALDVKHNCGRWHLTGLLLNVDTGFSDLYIFFAVQELKHCCVSRLSESHSELQRVLGLDNVDNIKVPVKNLFRRTILRLRNTIRGDIAARFKTKALYNLRRFFRRVLRKLCRVLRRFANKKAARITHIRRASHYIAAITAS